MHELGYWSRIHHPAILVSTTPWASRCRLSKVAVWHFAGSLLFIGGLLLISGMLGFIILRVCLIISYLLSVRQLFRKVDWFDGWSFILLDYILFLSHRGFIDLSDSNWLLLYWLLLYLGFLCLSYLLLWFLHSLIWYLGLLFWCWCNRVAGHDLRFHKEHLNFLPVNLGLFRFNVIVMVCSHCIHGYYLCNRRLVNISFLNLKLKTDNHFFEPIDEPTGQSFSFSLLSLGFFFLDRFFSFLLLLLLL